MKSAGFTLVELMITIAVAGIVAAFAVPSFTETVRNHQLRSSANDFYTLVRFAKAESVRRGSTVIVQATDNADWKNGAQAVLDDASHTELRRVDISGNLTVSEASNKTDISFNGKGFLASEAQFLFCRDDGSNPGRQVRVLISGFSAVSETGGC